MKLNKKNLNYLILNILLVIDLVPLYFIKNNVFWSLLYTVFNIIIISLLCFKMNDNLLFVLFCFLFFTYSYGIEVLIHYLNRNTFIEMQYLSFVPLLFLFFRRKKKNTINKTALLCIFYLMLNFLIVLISNKTPLLYFLKSIIPYISVFIAYYAVKDKEIDIIPLFKFILFVSIFMSTIQFFLHFHQDTRNGIFGINGISIFSLFVTTYSVYCYTNWLRKRGQISKLIFSILLAVYILSIIENKAGIIIYFVSLILIPVLSRRISFKTLISVILFLLLLPYAYKILIFFNPKFYYLMDFNRISSYFFGNNNWGVFKYGRFESLRIVFNELDTMVKLFGSGIGCSTPTSRIFYIEAGRELYLPYYTVLYGYYHGFILTGISTLVLDGGILLLSIVTLYMIRTFKKIFKEINIVDNSNLYKLSAIRFNAFLLLMFYLIYSNIFTSYRFLIVIGCLMGLSCECLDYKEIGDKNE